MRIFRNQRARAVGIAAGLMLAITSLAYSAGMFQGLPIIAGSSYCSSFSTGATGQVCNVTVPAGPSAITGSELVPMDTALASGQTPQTALATTATLASYGRSTGLLYTSIATATGTTGTSEQTLATYSLPASTAIAGTKLRIKASFSAAANGNNKTFQCYFGTVTMTSGVLTTNAKNGSCELIVTFKTASTQIVYGNMLVDTTPITGFVNASATEAGTAAIVIKFTGTGGTTGADITVNDFSVERLGA